MILSKTVSKLVWQFMSGNFLSKVSGLARDVTMAYFFGADAIVAAFIVAYRMANLLRRLFGEGALVAGFIPHFESLKVESEPKAFQFFKSVSLSMSTLLVGIIALVESLILLSHFFGDFSKDTLYIIDMTGIMFPSILFICLYGIYSGVLQSYKKFFQTSIAPVVFNLSWILVMLMSKHLDKKQAMFFLSIGVLIGFIAQFTFTYIQVKKIQNQIEPIQEDRGFKIFSTNLKPLFSSLIAGVIGVGATQINNAFDVIFARIASLEGPAYLTYGIRVQQLPLSVFVIALSSVMLPQLSRLMKLGQTQDFVHTLKIALHRTFFILVPITCMCFVIGGTFINIIYGRGGFDQIATIQTTRCLWAYAVGLIPMGFVILLAPAFYAQKDYKITTIASIASVLVNLSLNAVFVSLFSLDCTSVAYATSIASYVNMLILVYFLKKKVGVFVDRTTLKEFIKIAFSASFAFVATLAINYFFYDSAATKLLFSKDVFFPRDIFVQFFEVFSGISFFIAIYLISCFLLKVEGVDFSRLRKIVSN